MSEASNVPPAQHLFVLVSSSSQPRQQDVRKNIHVQRVAYRKRKLASAQKLRETSYLQQPKVCRCLVPSSGLAEQQQLLWRQTVSPRTPDHKPDICQACKGELNQEPGEIVVGAKPLALLGRGNSDPFAAMPTTMNNEMYSHLNHFVHVLGPLTFPVQTRQLQNNQMTGWVHVAITDAAMMQSTIAMGAIHRLLLEGKPIPVILSWQGSDYLLQKMKAVQMINENLNHTKDAVSDVTIGAVAMLAACESITGQIHETETHFKGLQEMVRQRGGINRISPVAAHQIASIDAKTAAVTGTSPRFGLFKPPQTASSWTIPSSLHGFSVDPELLNFGSRLLSKELSIVLAPPLIAIFADLKRLVIFNEICKAPGYVSTPGDLDFFNVQETAIEHQLLAKHALTTEQSCHPWSFYSVITECCRLAALIYTFTALWVFESNSAVLRSPMKQLQQTLIDNMSILFDVRWAVYSDVLLWVLFIGSHAASGQGERPFFVDGIEGLAGQRLGLKRWEDVRKLMRGFLYNERFYGAAFEAIWDESIMELKGEVS